MSKEYLPKEEAIFQAVMELFEEGADLNGLTVAEITSKAGIGKGTAYEYFSDKEEMIVKALFYNGEKFCQQIYEGMSREKNLSDKIDFVLLTMEQQASKTHCIFHLLHMLSDNSMISRRIKELLDKKSLSGEVLGVDIIGRILHDEFPDEASLSQEKTVYLVMSIYSKVLCFGMLLNDGIYKQAVDKDTMRKMVRQGICREIEEIFSLSLT